MYDKTVKGRNMMQNNRYVDILEELYHCNGIITMKDLAIVLNVSYKTIQNDISELKQILMNHGAKILSKKSSGVCLVIQDEQRFQTYYDSLKQKSADRQNRDEDLAAEMMYLLVTTQDYLKIDDLVDSYYFSRAKISSVLKELQNRMKEYHCEMISKPFYGIAISGDEKDIRKLIQSMYSFYEIRIRKESFGLYVDQSLISRTLKANELAITSTSLEAVCSYLTIALNRIRMNHVIEMDVQELSYCYEMKEYRVAETLAQLLEKQLTKAIPVNEIAALAQILSGNRKYDKESLAKFETSIHHDLDRLLHKIYDRIKASFHQDFAHDFELYVSLGLHMIPLISRIRFDFGIHNPLLDDIKRNYPLAYEIAVEASIVLREEFDIMLNEDEIGYFALHFHLALERKKQEQIPLKKVLIVCSSGGGLAKLLAFKVKTNFEHYIAHIDTTDIHEVSNMDFKDYDYILTTVPLQTQPNKPVLQISHMLSNVDIQGINDMLHDQKDDWGLLDILSPSDFFTDIEGENKDEVIASICDRLHKNHILQDDFKEQIFQREALFTTEIDHRIAFPHPLIQKSNETFMSITVLHKPIRWCHKLVQIVMIGNVKQGDSMKVQRMYEEFAGFVSDWDSILELIKAPSYETMTTIVNKLRRH